MNSNYVPLTSSVDVEEKMESENGVDLGNDIDLEKCLPLKYNSENESGLPSNSASSYSINPDPTMDLEAQTFNHNESTTSVGHDNSNSPPKCRKNCSSNKVYSNEVPLLFVFVISFSIVCIFDLVIFGCLQYNMVSMDDLDVMQRLSWFYASLALLSILMRYYYFWTKACKDGIKHIFKKWKNTPLAFLQVLIFNIIGFFVRKGLKDSFGEQWGLKTSLFAHVSFATVSIFIFIFETLKPGSCSVDWIARILKAMV
uniref:Wtf11 n=1 Tax=Schizosaccharomyces pombe TaxID=4896 RepID=A0A482AQL7_SCHPM|nr:Wtf11 [Schizosaccharomyces pombe]